LSTAHAQDLKYNIIFISSGLSGAEKPDMEGSGLLVDQEGFILTARHVVESANEKQSIKISFSRGGFSYPAKLFACANNKNVDLCLLKADPLDIIKETTGHYPSLSCRKVSESEPILAMGYPIGGGGRLSVSGRVSGTADPNFLMPAQLGAVPGMSGGPVLDTENKVVGAIKGAAAGLTQFQFFTPLQYAKSLFTDAGVDCDNSPRVCGLITKSIAEEFKSSNSIDPKRTHNEVKVQSTTGCRIIGATFTTEKMKNIYDPSIEIDKDGSNMRFSYTSESGPFTNPYSGVIDTTLTVKQDFR
jgi:S1-C subfamily serine protease